MNAAISNYSRLGAVAVVPPRLPVAVCEQKILDCLFETMPGGMPGDGHCCTRVDNGLFTN